MWLKISIFIATLLLFILEFIEWFSPLFFNRSICFPLPEDKGDTNHQADHITPPARNHTPQPTEDEEDPLNPVQFPKQEPLDPDSNKTDTNHCCNDSMNDFNNI